MSDLSILRTKLNPPRSPRHTLVRPRVEALLREALDHRVTIVQASTGYGKSTALAHLAGGDLPLFWYTASEGDADPPQFLAHLIATFRLGLPELPEAPLALLQETYSGLGAAVDALLNGLQDAIRTPSFLVIDDYHLAARPSAGHNVDALTDRFLSFLPNNLHVIISSRYPPSWENLVSWRARGEVLDIKREALAFTSDEITALFRDQYGLTLAPRQVAILTDKTEGWPIALQLVWQEIRDKPQSDLGSLLGPGSESLDTLFGYLAKNVLVQQPGPVQEFLLTTCILRELSEPACEVLVPSDCHAMVADLVERDLFIIAQGDSKSDTTPDAEPGHALPREHYRYHHLFHDFLREQAQRQNPEKVRADHRRAAAFFRARGAFDEAIYHLQCAGAFAETAALIEEIGEAVLRAGRLDTLSGWMDALPPDIVAVHPLLMFYLGDLARLRSRFDEALAWYAEAERGSRSANDVGGISRALRGQALVYLDTVRPARAEALLEQALRLSDGLDDRVARARLLELVAENKLNMGKAEEAEQLRLQASQLRLEGPSEDVLSIRVKLRTGRLDEARAILETWAEQERGQPHPPRAHRETLLILALIHAFQGHADEAFAVAREGLTVATQLGSPFVAAVGHMRMGHALQIRGNLTTALEYYDKAVVLGDQLSVRRTRAEAMWGMTRAHGYSGDLESARRDAAEGIEIGQAAGDAWIVALIQTALGASLVRAQEEREAISNLDDALAAFRSCADTFGQTVARLWLARAYWQRHQRERALAHLGQALALALTHHYDYAITRRTLLGWDDARVVVPLLLELQERTGASASTHALAHAAYAKRLLTAMGLDAVTLHPGYQLRVQTFGGLRVWRGDLEISAPEWSRRRARELFQLFITWRHQWIDREQIFEFLWPGEPPATAARDFKVALNTLMNVLEPERPANEPSAYIERRDSTYRLRAGADLWIDAAEFSELLARADQSGDLAMLRHALSLYQDDYMVGDARYADWATAERERLLSLYLRSADRLAADLLARGECDECIAWCERILARDHCWEHAYRLLMRAHAARGDRAQARRVFDQCTRVLRQELDAEPSEATLEVWEQVRAHSD